MSVCASQTGQTALAGSAGPPPPLGTAARVREATRADAEPASMRHLAADPELLVRAALAINDTCSPEIDVILAADADDRVRALLGTRIARLLPSLAGDVQNDAAEHVRSLLATLARDQATRVRAAIAEEVKSMDLAPHDLTLLLAQDEAHEVSGPVLSLSPVLTDADLLSLLATPPTPASADAIAMRPNLSAVVADSIATHADAPTIRLLLTNRSACIQEATLDALVGRAPSHIDWHAPLVRRPSLSSRAIRAMSEFIAVDLLRVLASRADLGPAKLDVVRRRLVAQAAREDDDGIRAEAVRLNDQQGLTDELMISMIESGDLRRLLAYLAAAGGVSARAIQRIVELRSAKALVSLVWRGDFSMRIGPAIQIALLQLAPDQTLQPTDAGDFPLTTAEMQWQLELMHDDMPADRGR